MLLTSQTVGYGDLTLKNQATKIFLIFYVLISTLLLALAFNHFHELKEEKERVKLARRLLLKRQNLDFIIKLDKGQGITEHQFVLAILEHLGTIDYEEHVLPWKEVSSL